MPAVQKAATTGELHVVKAVPHTSEDHLKAEDRLLLKRVKVRTCDDGNECTASGPKGLIRCGRPMGIKPDLHWVIKSLPTGEMEIRPVKGWYDLAASRSAERTRPGSAASAEARRAGSKAIPRGEAGAIWDVAAQKLQQEAQIRKESADRWDAMNKRRQQRIEDNEGARRADVLVKPETPADDETNKMVEEKRRKAEVLYPEDSAVDETGLKVQDEKRRKVLQKLQKAQDAGAEEQAVPDVASTLLELKRQQGEGAWDFSDEEEFSDDEEKDREETDTKEVQNDAEDPEHLPSGDEEAEDEAKVEQTLSGVGEELQVLLKVDPEARADSPDIFFEEIGEEPSPQDEPPAPSTLTDRPPLLDPAELRRSAVAYLKEKGEVAPKDLLEVLGVRKESGASSLKCLKEVLTFDRKRGKVKLKT